MVRCAFLGGEVQSIIASGDKYYSTSFERYSNLLYSSSVNVTKLLLLWDSPPEFMACAWKAHKGRRNNQVT